MFWQKELYRSGVAMTFNQTYEEDLPKTGHLGSIVAYIRSTANAAALNTVRKWRLIDYISKIEIIADGGEIIKSFDGRQALASSYYDSKVVPMSLWRTYSNTVQRQVIPIHFGRAFYDTLHFLDLSRFNNVKIRITNDATATEFTTSIQVDLVLCWLRENPSSPLGYYREEEWKTWAPVAAAWEYNQLPTKYPIRRILLRGRPGVDTADFLNNSSMWRLLSQVDFTLRTGLVKVISGDMDAMLMMVNDEFGHVPYTMVHNYGAADFGFDVGLGYVEHSLAAPATKTAAPATFPATVLQADNNDGSQVNEVLAADAPQNGLFRGHGYGYCVPVFRSLYDDDRDLLDPQRENVVDLNVFCASGTTVTGTSVLPQSGIILSRLVS